MCSVISQSVSVFVKIQCLSLSPFLCVTSANFAKFYQYFDFRNVCEKFPMSDFCHYVYYPWLPRVLGGTEGSGRGWLQDYKNIAVAGPAFTIRKNVTNKYIEKQRKKPTENSITQATLIPMDHRVEQANTTPLSNHHHKRLLN